MENNNSGLERREFLKRAAIVSIGFAALSRCTIGTEKTNSELVDLALKTDPKGYLDLPEGFTYKVISKAGNPMAHGLKVPGRPDGMGAFTGANDRVILIRNHENDPDDLSGSPFGAENELLPQVDKDLIYDAGLGESPGLGGTTTLVFNEATGEVEQEYLSLAGTYRNCAGGITPWQSWLTCEESVNKAGGKVEKDHGYVFEVPSSDSPLLAKPAPIKAMGRFNHEAVAVDPNSGIVYQTEDRHDGLIYRYVPNEPGKLLNGGKLQALVIKDQPGLDTRNWEATTMTLGQKVVTEWVDLDDVEAPEDDLRYRGHTLGAAVFARGEGMWYGEGEIYFACTNGGPNKYGQVFRYILPKNDEDNGILELFAQSADKAVLNMCDNLTVAPWGDVVLCEDNGERNHIRIINKRGEISDFGRNMSSRSEFAGLCFSPSGKTLFVNIQENGDTLAISGPWERLA